MLITDNRVNYTAEVSTVIVAFNFDFISATYVAVSMKTVSKADPRTA